MMKCLECKEIFDEPIYYEVSAEVYYGVASDFDNSYNKVTVKQCPHCGSDNLIVVDLEDLEAEVE